MNWPFTAKFSFTLFRCNVHKCYYPSLGNFQLLEGRKLQQKLVFFFSSFKGHETLENREKQFPISDGNDKPLLLMSSVWSWRKGVWLLIRLKVQGIKGD